MLANLVMFYRSLGNPSIKDDLWLDTSVVLNDELYQQLKQVEQHRLVSFDELVLDGEEKTLDEISATDYGKELHVTCRISTGDCKFYSDIKDLLKRNSSLSKGDVNVAFYVAEDDYYSAEQKQHLSKYQQLNAIVLLIHELKDLAHYHDSKIGQDALNLVFVREAEGTSSKSLQLTPRLSSNLVEVPPIDISVIVEIGQQSAINPHIGREKSVFRSTVIEFLTNSAGNVQDKFAYLVLHWAEFITLFKKNFDTYISGFAFHKARKEVADAEVAAADQLAKVLNDISGKILGIPISLGSLLLIVKAENVFEQLVLVLATLLASWLLAELMHNQQLQLARIKDARSILFDEINIRAVDYPEPLRKKIESTTECLDKNEKKVTRLLLCLRLFSWLPAVAAALLLIHLNASSLMLSIEVLDNYFSSLLR